MKWKKTLCGPHDLRVVTSFRISRLPKAGSIEDFANVLGVSRQGVGRWVREYGAPAKRRRKKGRWVYYLEREPFIAWLEQTGHYVPHLDYGISSELRDTPQERRRRKQKSKEKSDAFDCA